MISVRAPFRLPIGGGGTDLPSYYSKYEGLLITAAVNKYMYININIPALVNKIMVRYSITETVTNIEDLKHDIVKNTLKHFKYFGPLHINSMADISAGTGLGSSSAYTVALIRGMTSLLKKYYTLQELAELACTIEIEMCKKPIGKQDQYASTFGGINALEIDRTGNVTVIPITLPNESLKELEYSLMMFYTNIERDANEILGEQSEKAAVDEKDTINSMHSIKEIGCKIKDSLVSGDIFKIGTYFHEHWQCKKKISTKMTDKKINEWYEIAMNNGAIGGKIMGAGGGGFFLFQCQIKDRKRLRAVLEKNNLQYMDFAFDFDGVKLLSNH